MAGPPLIDLSKTIPTLLPSQLRRAALQAIVLAADPLNVCDENPHIKSEWVIVAAELRRSAVALERHFMGLFQLLL